MLKYDSMEYLQAKMIEELVGLKWILGWARFDLVVFLYYVVVIGHSIPFTEWRV